MPGTKLMFFSLKCLAPTCLRVLRIGYWVSENGMKGSGCPPLDFLSSFGNHFRGDRFGLVGTCMNKGQHFKEILSFGQI